MITIGIPTYNRKNILKKMAESLYLSNLNIPYNIRVYDDCSSEYSITELRGIFPNATQFSRNEMNLKADKNTYIMYKDFLNSNDQFLFNADSDLVFSENWLEEGLDLLKDTDGVLSLFNAQNLKILQNVGDRLCVKTKIGAAGSLLTRECVSSIIDHISLSELNGNVPCFDFKWCEFLQRSSKKIYCVRESLVQHIGVTGQNTVGNHFDFGIGFHVDNSKNGQFINDAMELYFSTNIQRNSYFLFPFERIIPKSKIILYGFGKVGQDFIKQIERTGYCEIVGIVDKNYSNFNGFKYKITSPRLMKELDADYLVVAVNSDRLAKEIIDEIKEENKELWDKVVYEKNRIVDL